MKQRNYKTSTKQDTTLYGIDSQDEMKVTQAHMASSFVKSVNAHGLGPSDTQTFRDQFANVPKLVRQLQIGLKILTLPTQ
jgi:hypothetical protein